MAKNEKNNIWGANLSLKQRLKWCLPAAIFAIFSFFAILAANGTLEIGKYAGVCGFYQKYQRPCPCCGMSRAIIDLFNGNAGMALYQQPAAVVLTVLGLVLAIAGVIMASRGSRLKLVEMISFKYIVLLVLMVLMAGWAWRWIIERYV